MTKLEKYVKLIVRKGVNIQSGQKLMIACPVDCAYFARMLMKEAYTAGAQEVLIRWNDDEARRIRGLLAPDSAFGVENAWEHALIKQIVDEGYNVISVSAEDPEALKGVNTERLTKDAQVRAKTSKPLSEKISSNKVQWTIASIPTKNWAKKVFPNAKDDNEAMDLMWDAIFAATRVDDNDPIENWDKHISTLQAKVKFLMEKNFKYLHFRNKLGTDLKIELPEGHIWVACGEKASTGANFIANMPTEEVFTAPLRTGVNGIVYATKPLVHMGNLIDDFWIKFEDGKVIEYYAKKGQDILEKLITTEENANYLGEVALVPFTSPISQSGILWYNTLYDENASCHLALGRAYPVTVSGTEGKTEDELNAMGVNQSLTHSDFMMGSEDLEIMGITKDGKEIPVFVNGNWA